MAHDEGIQEAFGFVLFAVVAIAAVVAILSFASSRDAYRQIGRGGLSLNEDRDERRAEPPPALARAQRDEEIVQMLEARNARRVARGREPVDVGEELARLTAQRPAATADAGLREEVRQLVQARSDRMVRRGEEPLDIEAEVARQLRELAG